jgi:6-pyruvoyl-tetrahydropterin synthase
VRKLVDKWDHGCLLNRKDPVFELLIQRSSLDQSKIIGFDGEPTAEAMAKELWLGVAHELHSNHISGVTIRSVDVWETDVNCATYRS